MASTCDRPSGSEQIFLRSNSAQTKGSLLILGGIGGLVFAVIGFVVAQFARPDQLSLYAMTTLPALIGIGALTGGWMLLRTPYQVAVSAEGLTMETRRGVRRLCWDDIGSATVETGGLSHRRSLNITDRHGRSLVKLDESFNEFDLLVTLVGYHVEGKGDDTALRILRKKARRNAALMLAVGLAMAAGSPFLAWTTHENQRAARLLREQGQPGLGTIVRRFVAPNGVTKRIEYAVGNTRTRNVEVEPVYWNRLEGAKAIPVIYVPDEPGISRLAQGELTDRDYTQTPAIGYGMSALCGLIALLMLAGSPFAWHGWDLAHDSTTGKWSVKRFGKVVWSS